MSRAHSLRRSLKASIAEGMVAEVFSACTAGTVLTAWALHLGVSPLRIALLASLPYLGQLVQMPAAWLTAWRGCRGVALFCVFAARLVFLPLVFLPWLPLSSQGQQALLLGTAASSALLGVAANNAWTAWMGDLVPERLRGRYFGKRTALCALAGAISSLMAGALLDAAKGAGLTALALSGFAAAACVAGVTTTLLMRRQAGVPSAAQEPFSFSAMLLPYRERRFRALLGYLVLWNGAAGIASAFYGVHMLQNLGLGFLLVALYHGGVHAVRILSASFWGRVIDRFGARPVLLACSMGLVPLPLLWLLPPALRVPMLTVDVVIYGFLWAGHGLAAFALPLAITRREERPFTLAGLSAAGGLAFAGASALGGLLLQKLPATFVMGEVQFVGFQVLFTLSALGRALAVWWGRGLLEPHAPSTRTVFRHLRTTAAQRLAGARLVPGVLRR